MSVWFWSLLALLLLLLGVLLPLRRGQDALIAAGLTAVIPALLVLLLPGLLAVWSVVVWLVTGLLLFAAWRQWLLPRRQRRQRQQTERQEAIGEAGVMVRPSRDGQPGVARFEPPLLGRSEWPVNCEQPAAAGDLVFVSHAGENVLTVVRLEG